MNIVFASGFLIPQTFFGFRYFRGMRDLLPSDTKALLPAVPVISSIKVRAERLAAAIATGLCKGILTKKGRFIVSYICMGGPDLRFLLAENLEGLRSKVASLTTISTPHWELPSRTPSRGSCVLLVSTSRGSRIFNGGRHEFQRKVSRPARHSLLLHCGYWPSKRLFNLPALAPTHARIVAQGQTDTDQKNDGLVSQPSATWGTAFA